MISYRRNQALAWQKLNQKTLIIDLQTNKKAHQLDEVGSFLWESLGEKKTLNDLRERLTTTYAIDDETAHEDILNFITELEAQNLIEAHLD